MKNLNKNHNTVWFGCEGTVELVNVEVDDVTELIVVPCPAWADRHAMAEAVKEVARARDLY